MLQWTLSSPIDQGQKTVSMYKWLLSSISTTLFPANEMLQHWYLYKYTVDVNFGQTQFKLAHYGAVLYIFTNIL